MSGIFGGVGGGLGEPELRRMSADLAHRGSDEEVLHRQDGIALGCRILRTGEPAEGRQPGTCEGGVTRVVLDGAVLNARLLRAELARGNERPPPAGDAHLVAHLYARRGPESVGRLRGAFAIAIWDAREQKLVLVRDHLGQKPVFYTERPRGLAFASEIKALLSCTRSDLEVDLESLNQYLSLRFVPGERTMVGGISKVPPGHFLVHRDGTSTLSRYWRLSFANKLNLTADEYVEGLEGKLRETVEAHCTTGVDTGAFLSGGLDSSLIVAMMARSPRETIPTFSIGFAEERFDETRFARIVADTFGTLQREAVADPDMVRSLPEMVHGLDEPSDPVAASFYAASRLAAEHVKVALGGDGGNELFAGSDRYRGVLLAAHLRRVPGALRGLLLAPLIGALPSSFGYESLKLKLRWFDRMAGVDGVGERLAEAVSFFRFSASEKAGLLMPRVLDQLDLTTPGRIIEERYGECDSPDPIERMQYTDYSTRLPEHLLTLVDRMGMVHGLEVRSPLVDRELVEYVASFPRSLKVRGRRARWIWYELAGRRLPGSIARRKKRGFRFPLATWFASDLQPVVRGVFNDSTLVEDGLLRPEPMLRLAEEHRRRRVDHSWRIWMLLNLEVWNRLAIRRDGLAETKRWIEGHYSR